MVSSVLWLIGGRGKPLFSTFPQEAHNVHTWSERSSHSPKTKKTKAKPNQTPQDFLLKTFGYPVIIMHLTKIMIRTLKLIKLFLNRIFPLLVVIKRKFIYIPRSSWQGEAFGATGNPSSEYRLMKSRF